MAQFFLYFPKRNLMGETKKKRKPVSKSDRADKRIGPESNGHSSGASGSGGSRQGNVGHESTGQSDNSHR